MSIALPTFINLPNFAKITDDANIHYYEKGQNGLCFDDNIPLLQTLGAAQKPPIQTISINTPVTIEEYSNSDGKNNTQIKNSLEWPYLKVSLGDKKPTKYRPVHSQ